MRSSLRAVLFLLCSVLSLASCGNGDPGDASSADGDVDSDVSSPADGDVDRDTAGDVDTDTDNDPSDSVRVDGDTQDGDASDDSQACSEMDREVILDYTYEVWTSDLWPEYLGIVLRVTSDLRYDLEVNAVMLNDAYLSQTQRNGVPPWYRFNGQFAATDWQSLWAQVAAPLGDETLPACYWAKSGDDVHCERGELAILQAPIDTRVMQLSYGICPLYHPSEVQEKVVSAVQQSGSYLQTWAVNVARPQLAILAIGAACPQDMSICEAGSYCGKTAVCTATSPDGKRR